jgi:hypothetical protein
MRRALPAGAMGQETEGDMTQRLRSAGPYL